MLPALRDVQGQRKCWLIVICRVLEDDALAAACCRSLTQNCRSCDGIMRPSISARPLRYVRTTLWQSTRAVTHWHERVSDIAPSTTTCFSSAVTHGGHFHMAVSPSLAINCLPPSHSSSAPDSDVHPASSHRLSVAQERRRGGQPMDSSCRPILVAVKSEPESPLALKCCDPILPIRTAASSPVKFLRFIIRRSIAALPSTPNALAP